MVIFGGNVETCGNKSQIMRPNVASKVATGRKKDAFDCILYRPFINPASTHIAKKFSKWS